MKKYYKFAGVELEIAIQEKWMYEDDKSLSEFRIEKVENPHRFQFEIVDQLSPPVENELVVFPDYRVYGNEKENIRYIGSVEKSWETAYVRATHRAKEHYVQLKASEYTKGFGVKTVLNAVETEHLVVEKSGFILHASYIEWNGKAILFTAPSGTGKSTQAELWHKYRKAGIVNGDRAAVRIVEEKAFAAGIPFSGSSSYCLNKTLPIASIVCLQKASVTNIQRIEGITAFQKIWGECTVNTWNKHDLNKVVDLMQLLIQIVPVYHLACTPDESAVIALENALKERESI